MFGFIFKNFKIAGKLLIAFGIILIMMIGTIISSILNVDKVAKQTEEFYNTSHQGSVIIWEIRRDIRMTEASVFQAVANHDPLLTETGISQANASAGVIATKLEQAKAYLPSHLDIIEKALQTAKDAKPNRDEVLRLAALGENEKAIELMNETYLPQLEAIVNALDDLGEIAATEAQNYVAESKKVSNQTLLIMIIYGIVAILLTMILTVVVSKDIVVPLKKCVKRLELFAIGDLSSDVPVIDSNDEIKQLADSLSTAKNEIQRYIQDIDRAMSSMANGNFDISPVEEFKGDFSNIERSVTKFIANISEVLKNMHIASLQVSSGSNQVSSGAQALAQGATEQASAVEELSSSLEEISIQVAQNATDSEIAKNMAGKATSAIENSNLQMQNLMLAMNDINEKSGQISKIIKTIEDIAFQTNILALNAAVEAARAGSAGKGFAVVADEVRNLASKSAEAAKNTTVLIEDSINAVKNGTELADKTAKELLLIVGSANETKRLVENVSQSSKEQAISITQINIGVEQISAVVQTNSATSEESAAASEELSSQATLMQELVNKFNLKK